MTHLVTRRPVRFTYNRTIGFLIDGELDRVLNEMIVAILKYYMGISSIRREKNLEKYPKYIDSSLKPKFK